jgi:hypothetical protein
MKKAVLLFASHLAVLAVGFGLGIYLLPILSAPPAPSAAEAAAAGQGARYTAEFRRDLKGSDALHYGVGKVSIAANAITLAGKVTPGPAYKLYLVPEFVETEADFQRVKARSLAVGDIKTFENFIVPVAAGTPLENYNTVLVWCESFSQFITAGKYR